MNYLRFGEALSGHFKQLCRLQLVESDLWERMAKFATEQVDARREVAARTDASTCINAVVMDRENN